MVDWMGGGGASQASNSWTWEFSEAARNLALTILYIVTLSIHEAPKKQFVSVLLQKLKRVGTAYFY